MNDIFLNLGCSAFKLNGFINIDIDESVQPDLCIDLLNLDDHFKDNSVDFIFAGHVFEHFKKEDSQKLMNICFKKLKSHRNLLAVVPDYTKATLEHIATAERIILAEGDHQMLFHKDRMRGMLFSAGFQHAYHIEDLREIPYLLVSNIHDPQPDLWQTGFIALKV